MSAPDPPFNTERLISGLLCAAAASLVFGFVIGMFTLFIGGIPGAIIGYIVGFWWGFNRVGKPIDGSANTPGAVTTGVAPTSLGDTVFLLLGFFVCVWLAVAVPNVFFGYSGPYKGSALGLLLPLFGLLLAPVAALTAQKQARRRFKSPQREMAGIALLVAFLLFIALWWRWAVARDAATSRRLYPTTRQYQSQGNKPFGQNTL